MAARVLMKILLLLTRVFKAGALLTLIPGPASARLAAVAPLAAASLATWVTSLN